jgi:hypothetical protein
LENPIPKTHTNFIFRDKVMMYILCVWFSLNHMVM